MEQLDYSLLFRWFVGLNMDDPIWDVTVLTKDRQRLLAGDSAGSFRSRPQAGMLTGLADLLACADSS